MTRRATTRRASSSPRVMILGWAVIAAAGVVGLASLPPTGGVDQAGVGPSTVRTAATVTASPDVFAAGLVAASPSAGETAAGTTGAAAVAQPASAAATAGPAPAVQVARIAAAVRTALAQVGLPYVWGGNGPSNGDAGFDCSGLTHFAYAAAGIALPRTAHTQFYAGPHVPTGAPLQAGDLVFYGTPTFVHHVGMYLGAGRMVNAPTFGEPVQVAYYRWSGDDYVGATRPDGSTSAAGLFMLPFIPEVGPSPVRPSTRTSDVFAAPRAPLVPAVPVPALGAVAVPEAQTAAAVLTEQQVGAPAVAAPASAARVVPAPTTVAVVATPSPIVAAPASLATASTLPTVVAAATSDVVATTTTTIAAPSSTSTTEAAAPTSKEGVVPPPAPASKVVAVPPAPAPVATKKKPAAPKKPPVVVTTSPPTAASSSAESSAAVQQTPADETSTTLTTTTTPEPTSTS